MWCLTTVSPFLGCCVVGGRERRGGVKAPGWVRRRHTSSVCGHTHWPRTPQKRRSLTGCVGRQARNPLRDARVRTLRRASPASVMAVRAMAMPVKVGVLMGSPNDLPKMKGAVETLRLFGLEPDVRVRTPPTTYPHSGVLHPLHTLPEGGMLSILQPPHVQGPLVSRRSAAHTPHAVRLHRPSPACLATAGAPALTPDPTHARRCCRRIASRRTCVPWRLRRVRTVRFREPSASAASECESDQNGFRVADELTPPFHHDRAIPSNTRL